MDEELFYWSLTLKKGGKAGILKGSYHEMLVDEKVTKTTGERNQLISPLTTLPH